MREDFKVVHLVSTDSGGAYRAANRINMALKQNGVNSSIVVLEKKHMDSPVIDVLNNKIECCNGSTSMWYTNSCFCNRRNG